MELMKFLMSTNREDDYEIVPKFDSFSRESILFLIFIDEPIK